MYDPTLTKEEIRGYLHIYNEITEWRDDELVAEGDVSPDAIYNKKIEKELTDQVSRLYIMLIAERLWQNKREVPLMIARDTDDLIEHLITTTLKRSGVVSERAIADRAILEGMLSFVKPQLDSIAEDLRMPNAYDDEWRKIEIMQCACNELNVMPKELLHISGIGEQIIRHLYPDKESYRARLEKSLKDLRSGISALRLSMYKNMLIEYGGELDAGIEREIRAMAVTEADKLETRIITAYVRKIESIMRRIWPE